ncbi:MAG: hypothetical protein K6E32_05270, partial [Lachnospiraceae bacterium]|nr:hypothetical protein [Lachnospiraceae bacterium]
MKYVKLILIEFVVLIAVYLIGLTVANLVDTDRLQNNAGQALDVLDAEGDYPIYYDDFAVRLDNVSDRLIVKESSLQGSNPLYTAIDMNGYYRYWHGYALFLRPLLAFLGLNQIRKILMILIGLVFAVTTVVLYKKLGIAGAAAFSLMWVEYYSSKVSGSLQFFWCYFIMCAAVIFICIADGLKKEKEAYCILFFGLGSFTNFVDLLTFPLVTLTVPLAVLVIIKRD